MNERTALVLGAGIGGLSVATELAKLLGGNHTVTLMDRKSRFYECAYNLGIVSGEVTDPATGEGDFSAITSSGIEFVRAEIKGIDVRGMVVKTTKGDFHAEFIVISMGAEMSPGLIPGLAQGGHNVYEKNGAAAFRRDLERMNEGRFAVLITRTPFKCPAAPYEIAFLIDSALRQRGIRDDCSVDVYTPEWQPMLAAGDMVGNALVGMLRAREIGYHTEHMVLKVDYERRNMMFEIDDAAYDLMVYVPPHNAPESVRQAGLTDSTGWIPVNAETLETKHPGIFAIGDIASIRLHNGVFLPMAGVFALQEGAVVAANIASRLGMGAQERFAGGGYCFIETGGGKAAMGSGNFYAKPAPTVTFEPPSEEHKKTKDEFSAAILEAFRPRH
ncbi:MAG: FAD/NAD(P)-binding oxidoreductase [Methanomassiliicoccales archaeon]|nr:FAD/NAD(P)-binding oxidoreductase [Methanomassiliicoccales archaeon]